MDIRSPLRVYQLIDNGFRPDIVVHVLTFPAADKAIEEGNRCFRITGDGSTKIEGSYTPELWRCAVPLLNRAIEKGDV